MATISLPPGFRFHPTDVELVKYYLKRKVMGKRFQFDAISELNIYKYCPWDLPDKSCLRSKDLEWYFFCPNERKYASGARTNRATESGFWKSTGRDRPVSYNEQTVGMVKTLVFHKGHAPRGERTDWVMYEYKLQDEELANAGIVQDAYALCKVFQKSGLGPRANAQYGAPFNEEDWDDDADFFGLSLPSNNLLPPELPYNNNDSVGTSMFIPGSSSCGPLSKPGPSNVLSLAEEVPPPLPNNGDYICLLDLVEDNSSLVPDHIVNDEVPPPFPDNGDYICLSDLVEDNSSLVPDRVVYNEVVENFIDETYNEGLTDGDSMYYNLEDLDNFLGLNGGGFNENNSEGLTCLDNLPELSRGGFDENNEELTSMDGDDFFYSLEDLDSGGGFNFSSNQTTEYGMLPVLAGDDAGFFELNDLNYQLNYPIGAAESEEFFTDSFYEPFYNNYLEQDYHPVDIFGEDVPAMNQLPLLPEGFNGHGDHFDLFQENSSVAEIDILGFTASSRDNNFTPRAQPEEGTGNAAEDQNRGQRKSYWRLQHLLESSPAHHASTAEHFAPASHSTYGGSSIHVKAEVTRRSGGCTNDALSQNLGESTYENCGSNLSITGFGKKAVKWGNRFAFFFFAGIISTLIRVFLVPVLLCSAGMLRFLLFVTDSYLLGSML